MTIVYTIVGVLLMFMGQGVLIHTIDRAPRRVWFVGIPVGAVVVGIGVVAIRHAATL